MSRSDAQGGQSVTAAEREGQGGANLGHPTRIELRDAAADAILRNGDYIVKVDGAGLLHPAFGT
jgi:hypothetical protein